LRRAPALLLLLACCVAPIACGTAPPAQRRSTDLLNARLSPAYAQWLVGPVAHLATEAEVQQFLALADDAAAQAFIDAFWSRRDPRPPSNGNPLVPQNLRERFDARAAEADRRFSEAGYLGRRTDRGTVWVLYGEPKQIQFDINPNGPSPVERWTYAANAPVGLDGRHPLPAFRFVKSGDLTVLYHERPTQQRRPGVPSEPPT